MSYVIYNKKTLDFLEDKPSDASYPSNSFKRTYNPRYSPLFDLEEGVKTAKRLGDDWKIMTTYEAYSMIRKVPYNEAKIVIYDGDEYEVVECRESHNPESYVEDYFILYGNGAMIMVPDFDCEFPSRIVGNDVQFFE